MDLVISGVKVDSSIIRRELTRYYLNHGTAPNCIVLPRPAYDHLRTEAVVSDRRFQLDREPDRGYSVLCYVFKRWTIRIAARNVRDVGWVPEMLEAVCQ